MANYNGTHDFTSANVISPYGYIHLQDVKASGTSGGTATSGTWETRVLNTKVTDIGGHCELSSNQFTLAVGIYEISATAPAYYTSFHRAKLYNVTDALDEIFGTNAYSTTVNHSAVTTSNINGSFVITAEKVFEIRHRVQATRDTNGYGQSSGFSTEIYTDVVLRKIG